ncbi:MAG TPA: alpha/beta hydrolase [Candidatus Acidoferrum sp.]|nr:alpha/beta hydrolase [Candidatus Acidoferrum sp.]
MSKERDPELLEHRRTENSQAAMVFIHGFSGDPAKTWGQFPELLMTEKRLSGWDIYSLGYHTGLGLDVLGIWRANPDLNALAQLLATRAGIAPLDRYVSFALIAHSMGGLIVQRALLNNPTVRGRVGYVLLFGTPSDGLEKAAFVKFWKPQLRGMSKGGEFISNLRSDWRKQFGDEPPFFFRSTGGDEDQFVPKESSLLPFPAEQQEIIRGDHLSIVKPKKAEDPAVQIVIKALLRNGESVAQDSARLAVEMHKFRKAIEILGDDPKTLDEDGVVQLALALESVGKRKKAIEVLENQSNHPERTDAKGVLAGRLKRRWLVERKAEDADRALKLYQEGFEASEKAGRHDQAFYHGINVAFMQLAYRKQEKASQQTAKRVLEHCDAAMEEKWQLATKGEANLVLGNTGVAMSFYQQATNATDVEPRQLDSMFQQAFRVASFMGNEAAADRLRQIFRGGT